MCKWHVGKSHPSGDGRIFRNESRTGLYSHVGVQLVTVRLLELFRLTLWSPCRSVTSSAATVVAAPTAATAAERRERLPTRSKSGEIGQNDTLHAPLVKLSGGLCVSVRQPVMRRRWLTVSCDLDPLRRESPQPLISRLSNWIYFQVWAQSFTGEPCWSAAYSKWGWAARSDTENSLLTFATFWNFAWEMFLCHVSRKIMNVLREGASQQSKRKHRIRSKNWFIYTKYRKQVTINQLEGKLWPIKSSQQKNRTTCNWKEG